MAIRRYFPWLLLACYAVAFTWPQPWLARQSIPLPGVPAWAGEPRLPLSLLAIILFFAALSLDVTQLRSIVNRPGGLLMSLAAVWFGPVLLVLLAGKVLTTAGVATGPLIGMALVAAMPVANSSVAWTLQAGGHLGWSLALVVLSIVLNPWITPQLLQVMGWSLAGAQAARVDQLVTQFSGAMFIVWVLFPTALGMICRMALGTHFTTRLKPLAVAVGAVCLLVLNYANASLVERPTPGLLAIAVVLSALLSLVGVGSACLVAHVAHLDRVSRTALMFGLSMKHNGLALALAGAMLHDQPSAILFIVVAILVQHTIAALIDGLLLAKTNSSTAATIQAATR
jgi:BASS family bile acid:Na+ symporter